MLDFKIVSKKLDSLSEDKKGYLKDRLLSSINDGVFEVMEILEDQMYGLKYMSTKAIVAYTAAAYIVLDFKVSSDSFAYALGRCNLLDKTSKCHICITFAVSLKNEGFTAKTAEIFDVIIKALYKEGKSFDFERFLNDVLICRKGTLFELDWIIDLGDVW